MLVLAPTYEIRVTGLLVFLTYQHYEIFIFEVLSKPKASEKPKSTHIYIGKLKVIITLGNILFGVWFHFQINSSQMSRIKTTHRHQSASFSTIQIYF